MWMIIDDISHYIERDRQKNPKMDDFAGVSNNYPLMDDYVRAIFIHFWKLTIPEGGVHSVTGKGSSLPLPCTRLHLHLLDSGLSLVLFPDSFPQNKTRKKVWERLGGLGDRN